MEAAESFPIPRSKFPTTSPGPMGGEGTRPSSVRNSRLGLSPHPELAAVVQIPILSQNSPSEGSTNFYDIHNTKLKQRLGQGYIYTTRTRRNEEQTRLKKENLSSDADKEPFSKPSRPATAMRAHTLATSLAAYTASEAQTNT